MSKVNNLIDKIGETLEDLREELNSDSAYAKPAYESPAVVQGRLRGSTLHIQKGTMKNYITADVILSQAEVESINSTFHGGTSLAGTGRAYVVGKEYPDGSIRIDCVTVKNPFSTQQTPEASRRY